MSDRLTTGTGPWLVSSEVEIDTKNKGSSNVEIWEGSETECRNFQGIVIANGATMVKLSPKGDGNWQLRAQYPFDKDGQNTYVDTMELEVNAIQRSCYQSPIYRSKFSDYNSITQNSTRANNTLPIIADCARKYQSGLPKREDNGKYKFNSVEYSTRELAVQAELTLRLNGITLTSGEQTTAGLLFENIAFRGVTSFIEYNHVFRRRVTAGNPNAIRANNVGGGQIWTSAEVISWEGIPQNGWFDLPPDVQWHKDKPRVIASYGSRTEISYSYTEVVTASALLYKKYGSAVLID